MLRPFIRAGVFDAHDPSLIIPKTATASFTGAGSLTANVVAKVGTKQTSAASAAFTGHGSLSVSVSATMTGGTGTGGGGTGAAVPYSAQQVIDSVGIDTHWSYPHYQSASSALQAAILDMGIMHIRDRIVTSSTNAAPVQALKNHGVKGSFILGAPWGAGFITSVSSAISAAKTYFDGCIETLEGPNEPDVFGSSGYASATHTWMNTMYPAIRKDSYFNGIPVRSPSFAFASGLTAYGSDAQEDHINMHTYLSGQVPETSRLDTWISESQAVYGKKTLGVTEWGYHTDINGAANWVDEATQADYMIRGILFFLLKNVQQASCYELMDESDKSGREAHFGILRSDQSYKPAATSVKNLLGRLKDTGTGSLITQYPYSYTTSGTDVQVMPIGRKDGKIDFAVWRKAAVFNFSTGARITVAPVAVNFTIGSAKSAVAYRVNTGASTTLTSSSTTFTVQADGNVQLVRVS